MDIKSILETMKKKGGKKTYIYGAGKIASSIMYEINEAGYGDYIKGFLVTSTENNPTSIMGLKVEDVHYCDDLEGKTIFIAVGKRYQHEVLEELKMIVPKSTELICIPPYALYILSQQTNVKRGKDIVSDLFDNRYYYSEDIGDVTYGELHMKRFDNKDCKDFYIKLDPVFVVRDFSLYKKKWRNYDLFNEYRKLYGEPYRVKDIEINDAVEDKATDSFSVYMVTSHLDKPSNFKDEKLLIPIQAGAALTDIKKYEIRDNIGNNISDRNKTLCELTAIYWIWKNSHSTKYKGLCHYRRHFNLDNTDYSRILHDDVDAVLATQRFNAIGNINTFLYARFIEPIDLEVVTEYIKNEYPDYVEDMYDHFSQNFFYNCNMVIAKEDVFNEYCQFLFDVILHLDNYFYEENIIRSNKFSAYFAELITSLYFYHSRKKLKIATCDFCFYE